MKKIINLLLPLYFLLFIEGLPLFIDQNFFLDFKHSYLEVIRLYFLYFSLNYFIFLFSNKKLVFYIYISIIFVFLIILQYINVQKILLRNEPISFYDFFLIEETAFVLKKNLEYHIIKLLTLGLVFLLILIGLFLLLEKISFFEKRISNKLLGFISFAILVFNFSFFQEEINWDELSFYQRNGFLRYLNYQIILLYSYKKPSKYSLETIKDIEKRISHNKNNEKYIRPDVVLILSESFWDPLIIEKLKLNKDPLPNYRNLKNQFFHSNLIVPTIGGGTANTEFEVLTGLRMDFLPKTSTPYTNFINKPINSLANIFNSKNYLSIAIHPNVNWFYNRNKVYSHFGFNYFFPLETFPFSLNYLGIYPSDDKAYDYVIQILKEDPKKNKFIFLITIQNHYPYEQYDFNQNPFRVLNEEFSIEEKKQMENYLYLLNLTDQQIFHFFKELKEIRKPLIIIFFGDHIPPFPSSIYKKLQLDYFRKKRVPFFIWSNYFDVFHIKNKDYYSYELFYLILLDILKIHTNESILFKENLLTESEWRLLQYDILFGNQFFYENIKRNTNFKIGLIPEVQNTTCFDFDFGKIICITKGKNFSLYTKVFIENEFLDFYFISSQLGFFFLNKESLEKENFFQFVILDNRKRILNSSHFYPLSKNNFSSFLNKDICVNQIPLEKLPFKIFNKSKNSIVLETVVEEEYLNSFVVYNNEFILKKILDLRENRNGEFLNQLYIFNGKIYFSIPNLFGSTPTIEEIKDFLKSKEYKILTIHKSCY